MKRSWKWSLHYLAMASPRNLTFRETGLVDNLKAVRLFHPDLRISDSSPGDLTHHTSPQMRPFYSTTTKITLTYSNTQHPSTRWTARSVKRSSLLASPFRSLSSVASTPPMLRPAGLDEYLSMPSCCCAMFCPLHMY